MLLIIPTNQKRQIRFVQLYLKSKVGSFLFGSVKKDLTSLDFKQCQLYCTFIAWSCYESAMRTVLQFQSNFKLSFFDNFECFWMILTCTYVDYLSALKSVKGRLGESFLPPQHTSPPHSTVPLWLIEKWVAFHLFQNFWFFGKNSHEKRPFHLVPTWIFGYNSGGGPLWPVAPEFTFPFSWTG